jgi:hypothetical protein
MSHVPKRDFWNNAKPERLPDITSVYNRYSYDAEKRRAMEFWDRQLTAVHANRSLARVDRFAV